VLEKVLPRQEMWPMQAAMEEMWPRQAAMGLQ
jgi:hypothetical protein